MRTSLTELQQAEQYLQGEAEPEQHLLMEARLQIDQNLAEKLEAQQEAYVLIKQYGREQLRREIAQVEQRIFTRSVYRRFQKQIRAIFN